MGSPLPWCCCPCCLHSRYVTRQTTCSYAAWYFMAATEKLGKRGRSSMGAILGLFLFLVGACQAHTWLSTRRSITATLCSCQNVLINYWCVSFTDIHSEYSEFLVLIISDSCSIQHNYCVRSLLHNHRNVFSCNIMPLFHRLQVCLCLTPCVFIEKPRIQIRSYFAVTEQYVVTTDSALPLQSSQAA